MFDFFNGMFLFGSDKTAHDQEWTIIGEAGHNDTGNYYYALPKGTTLPAPVQVIYVARPPKEEPTNAV